MRQIGKIKCLELFNNDNADLIIMFHGFGADAYDLQTLSDVLNTEKPTNWIFPQGVLEVPIGPGWSGRAWWNINMAAIQEAAARGEERDTSSEYPEGLVKIRPVIMDLIAKTNTPWNRIILGGFSQGAMLATDVFLNAPESPKGLIIFSGALICKEDWKKLVHQRAGKTFFMSHGKRDQVLSHTGAQRLETLLTQNGMKGKLHSFDGGHEIPAQIIQSAQQYLNSL